MTARATIKRAPTVRYDSLDTMPPASPLSGAFKTMTDVEAERQVADDPDAELVPAGFWDTATPVEPERKEQITLRLDPDVLRYFRSLGGGYQSRMNAVLKSYVKSRQTTG